MDRAVGIDLGTTYSLVAVMDGDSPRVIADASGNKLFPSVVAVDQSGTLVIGEDARKHRVSNARQTVSSVKRLMGKGGGEIVPEAQYIAVPLDISDEKIVKVKLGNWEWTPAEISALILRELKQRAEKDLGHEVKKVVITVPAYFNDSQRQATKDAGKIAGLEVIRIINEPTAASLAYGLEKKKQGLIVVYDFGGGTFDVSILKLKDGIFEVLATCGNTHLGGDDLDWALAQRVLKEMTARFEIKIENADAIQTIVDACEQAKRRLSIDNETVLEIRLSDPEIDYQRKINRDEFGKLIAPIVERTVEPCLSALRDAKLNPEEIDEVILVGGSTRVAFVRETVEKIFGKKPHSELDPDEVVALGAAVQAQVLTGGVKDILLLDVAPLSLGIESFGGIVSRIIRRNTTIPVQTTDHFTTAVDGQTSVDIHILQGERGLVKDCRSLGRFQLKIAPMPAGFARIEVTFIVDENGILKVRAKDLRTGTEESIQVKPSYGLTDEQVEKMLEDSRKFEKQDEETRKLVEVRNHAGFIINGAKRALVQGLELIGNEESKKIEAALKVLEETCQGRDAGLIWKTLNEFGEISNHLAKILMDEALKEALVRKKEEVFKAPDKQKG